MGWGRFGYGLLDDDQPIESWMDDRNDQVAQRDALDAAGRDRWQASTRSGENLDAGRPADVVALGLDTPVDSSASDDVSAEGRDVTTVPEGGPRVRYVRAKPGDNITRLAGSGDPVAVGAFARLNGMDGRNSTIYAGHFYAVPTVDGVPSPEDEALGGQLLRHDDARRAAIRGQRDANDQFQSRFDAGQNVWTGNPVAANLPMSRLKPPPSFLPQSQSQWEGAAKGAVGLGAYAVGTALGPLKAAKDAVGDAVDAGRFGLELAGALGHHAETQARREAADAARSAVGYVRSGIYEPGRVISDVRTAANRAMDNMSPANVDLSGSLGDVAKHQFDHGLNFGEAATNVAGLFAGGELVQGVRAASTFEATKAARVAKLVAEGSNPRLAEYLARPYEGMGHHVIPRRVAKDWNLPPWLIDNSFNVAAPRGLSRDDFYRYHYQVDPKAGGFRLPADLNGGKGWRPKELGLTKYAWPERTWKGMPVPVKDTLAAVSFADGPTLYDDLETPQ